MEGPVLGVLLLLVVASAPWWIKRVRPTPSDSTVHVLGRTALSRSAVIAVVRVGDRRLLVGAGDQGVHVLTELDPEDRPEAAPATSHVTSLHLAEDRTDAVLPTTVGDLPAVTTSGPRIGLTDRLRAMTVRTTPPPGRPFRVPSRR